MDKYYHLYKAIQLNFFMSNFNSGLANGMIIYTPQTFMDVITYPYTNLCW